MRSNVTSCSAWRLYAILDPSAMRSGDLIDLAAAAIRGGADVLQLRHKTASAFELLSYALRLLPMTRAARIPLIINDRADVAHAAGADGVHLGQDDLPLKAAREILGAQALIGLSTHSLEQALVARDAGADYIGLGPIFPTPTKPDDGSVGLALIGHVRSRVQLPTVCIGGIDQTNLPEVVHAGANCVAVVRAIGHAADPESATRDLKHLLVQ